MAHHENQLTTRSALYGSGVFTTIAVFDGEPFLWDKHWRRLTHDAAKIGIDPADILEADVRNSVEHLIRDRHAGNGRVRVALYDDRSSELWPDERRDRPDIGIEILIGEPRRVPEYLRLTISPYPVNSRSPLAGIKSCNYLENLLARNEAVERGFDEGIRLNERGELTSACMANLFWISNGQLNTPAQTTGCLPGTTREYILETLDCCEVAAGPDELRGADAIFLTSAGLGIARVDEFEGRMFERIDHPILKLLPETR